MVCNSSIILLRYLCAVCAVSTLSDICSCLCLVKVKMNYIVNSESDFNDLVVMIKKSETADLMDYTNSGQGLIFFIHDICYFWSRQNEIRL